jgi:gamma-glutamylcyclotransferase (GGCT)/AIG2-like uncharacterized protein YtfP
MKPDLLFVYGTLLAERAHPMSRVLARGATFAGAATIRGRLYEVRGYPGAVPSHRRGECVAGELYRLGNPAGIFAVLDDYEMCSARFPAPHEYRRARVTARRPDGGTAAAWAYLYNRPVGPLRRIESGNYATPV